MEKKEEIYQLIHLDTKNKINHSNLDHLGMGALEISTQLKMNRSNISRILNQLYNEGKLIKTSSRPVLFIDRSSINDAFQSIAIPSIIPKNKTINDYITYLSIKKSNVNSFNRYLSNSRQSKMYDPIAKAKSAILYPSKLNTLIYGEKGSGRLQFAKSLAQFAKENQLVDAKSEPIIVECVNYNVVNEDSFLKMIFGEYITRTESYKKGILQKAQNNIIIFNNINQLSERTSTALLNVILDKSYSPINSSKQLKLDAFIIATTTNKMLAESTEMLRCFPMYIQIPSLNDRTIMEIIVIILQFFQDEANNIKETIRVSKDAISCFAMSQYKGNLAQLRSEIRQACAMGYTNFIKNKSYFINIGFDEISTPVLMNIFNVDKRLNELYDTLNLFENEYLFFSANKQNPELNLLFEISEPNDNTISTNLTTKNDEQLVNQCINDIDSVGSIQINTIRAVLLQRIYDIIYNLLDGHPIKENENLIYGLLLHLSNEINRITSGQTHSKFKKLSNKIARNVDYNYANLIITSIEKYYNLSFNDEEIDYVATYLYLSSQWIDKKYIQLLIVSTDKEKAAHYSNYINNNFFKTHANYLSVSKEANQIESTVANIAMKMTEIDRGKGVVLLLDYPFIKQVIELLDSTYSGEFITTNDISIKNLVSIAQKVESLGTTLTAMGSYTGLNINDSKSNETKEIEKHAYELLKSIEEKLLSESLVFLNPHKACQALFNVLLNIINDLNITYCDDLLIKFLFHTTFTLERCIRKEPYNYPKAKTLIKNHEKLYSVLEKNFNVINEIFAIQIPPAEMGYIIEIFLPYLHITSFE